MYEYPYTAIDSMCAHGHNGKIFLIIETARCICMAPVSSGTLNYRKVNLSGGLAIGEFTSSIIKLLPLGEGGYGGQEEEVVARQAENGETGHRGTRE